MKPSFSIIVAVDENFGIGKDGGLPWNLPGDMRHFKEITSASSTDKLRNAVVMGRKTWESIPEKFRPLTDRLNIVLTRDQNLNLPSQVLKFSSLEDALTALEQPTFKSQLGKIFVIGGSEIFNLALGHPQCHELYLTHIQGAFQCDRFFPPLPSSFKETFRSNPHKDNGVLYFFSTYQRIS